MPDPLWQVTVWYRVQGGTSMSLTRQTHHLPRAFSDLPHAAAITRMEIRAINREGQPAITVEQAMELRA